MVLPEGLLRDLQGLMEKPLGPRVVASGLVQRGQIVQAFVVLKPGHSSDTAMAVALQEHVKHSIAPFKYPRKVAFVPSLPRTETGKLQRFKLRQLQS